MSDFGCFAASGSTVRGRSKIRNPTSEIRNRLMKVLVIGGTMFIGRLLVAELLKAGHEVTVMHRKPKHDLGKRVQNLTADRNDPESVRQALHFTGFQVVFDNVYDWE